MVWTYLRSCFGFDMRVTIGGVERIYPARWFFCDPDALPFPSPHGCESSPWLKDHETNESWGEIGRKKILDRGINPGYPGQCFIGDPAWFQDGQLPADLPTRFPPAPPPCCTYVPPDSTDPRCPPYEVAPCSNCLGGESKKTYAVTLANGEGVYAQCNGVWEITLSAGPIPCYWWNGDVFPAFAMRLETGGGYFEVSALDTASPSGYAFAFWNAVGPFDCVTPAFPFVFQSNSVLDRAPDLVSIL